MADTILGTSFICQIAMIVRDVEKASGRFAQLMGVPVPKIVLANEDGRDTVTYQGQPTKGRVKLAFFQMENLVIEFIEPTEDPTTWKDFLDTRGRAFTISLLRRRTK